MSSNPTSRPQWRPRSRFGTAILGRIAFDKKDAVRAARLAREAADAAKAEGKAWFRGVTLFGASERLLALGELETADQSLAQGLELLRSTRDLVNLPIALAAGAALASQLGDPVRAGPCGALPKPMQIEHLGRRRPPA